MKKAYANMTEREGERMRGKEGKFFKIFLPSPSPPSSFQNFSLVGPVWKKAVNKFDAVSDE